MKRTSLRILSVSLTFLVLMIFPAMKGRPQKIWTLEDCINHAWSYNVQVKQQDLVNQLSKISFDQSIASFFPTLNGSATYVYNYGQTIDPYTNSFASSRVQSNNFYLSSTITVFNGLQTLNNMRKKRFDFLASDYDLKKMKNDIALTIATAYLQVLFNIELLDVARAQLEITKEQVDRTQKLVTAKTLTQGSLLTIEAQQAGEEMNVVNAQNQLSLSYLTLAQMLDLTNADSFEIEKPAVILPDASALLVSPGEIYQRSLGVQPDIKSAEFKVRSAKTSVSISLGALSPQLALSGSWGTGYSGASKELTGYTSGDPVAIGWVDYSGIQVPVYAPSYTYTYQTKSFHDQIKANENKSIGLYLNVPIFNHWQVQTGISSAKINYRIAELNLQSTQNQLNKTIEQAHADAIAALNRYGAAQKSVDAYAEAFKYTQQKYDLGLLNSIDYNDAKNKLAKSRSDLLQAKYEYVFRVKVLDFYQGKALTLK